MESVGNPDVQIQDVMSINPIIIKKGETVKKAAELMKEGDVGSLLVLQEDGDLDGIVTEMDVVFDVVAEGDNPEEVTVEEIMSTPVHAIEGDNNIVECAKRMAELDIRRLPVTKGGELVGLITENDILEISPALLDITREYERIQFPENVSTYEEREQLEISGYCESCGIYSDKLVMESGQMLCPECR